VETQTVTPDSRTRDPLAGFDLDSLLSGGARMRPQRIALSDGALDAPSALTFADLDAFVSRTAAAWQVLGMQEGERVLIVSGARVAPLIALLGALRAGLDVALLPDGCDANALAQAAQAIGAVALCAEPEAGAHAFARLLEAGFQTETVRVLAGLDAEADGIAPLNKIAQNCAPFNRPPGLRKGDIITFDDEGLPCFHSQRTLAAAALDFITRAGILARSPILSTLAPTRFAGLIAGPLAALVSGAPLVLHGPFNAAALINLVDELGPSHLIAPGALLAPLALSGLLGGPRLTSITLLERCATEAGIEAHQRPMLPDSSRPLRGPILIDLLAIGEQAAIAQARQRDGAPAPMGASAHSLNLDGISLTAVSFQRLSDQDGARRIALSGAAVSGVNAHA
jgi:hypothetical protein